MLKRSAGVLIPLFSIRTRDDLGRGEILGVSAMLDLALAMRSRVVQFLPLNETAPGEASPYSALSVFAIDPIYISVGALEGVDPCAVAAVRAGRGNRRTAPRRKLRAAKLKLLEDAFRHFAQSAAPAERVALAEFAQRNRGWLDDYALFRALKDRFGFSSWETWPEGLGRRDPAALEEARRALAEPIRRFIYFQFAAHRQWTTMREEAGSRGAMLGGDLSFSPARESAEVWANQELFNLERSVGAPPDAFNARGQRWGLPMPNWERMRAEGHTWWRMRVRHAASLYDLFRVDHVVGLYRTFSFGPDPDEPGRFFPDAEDAQRAQGEELMRAIKEEAGGSAAIAEDLGTVPPWVRASLTALGVPGYKVFRWEKENWDSPAERFAPPSQYPELSVATTGTHDTETLAQWWRGAPENERRLICQALNLSEGLNPRRRKIAPAMLEAILHALYASPSVLVIVPIQDLFGWSARINVPGTVGPRNWSYRLPFALDPLEAKPEVCRRIERLSELASVTGRFEE